MESVTVLNPDGTTELIQFSSGVSIQELQNIVGGKITMIVMDEYCSLVISQSNKNVESVNAQATRYLKKTLPKDSLQDGQVFGKACVYYS